MKKGDRIRFLKATNRAKAGATGRVVEVGLHTVRVILWDGGYNVEVQKNILEKIAQI